jgi:hypothetical protein
MQSGSFLKGFTCDEIPHFLYAINFHTEIHESGKNILSPFFGAIPENIEAIPLNRCYASAGIGNTS